jgi:drug/metabolite transporter (DMT)-like permease
MFFGAVILFATIILLGKLPLLFELTTIQIRNLAISTGILFAYVFFWYYSIKFINVSKAAAILLLAPVISLAAGVIFLGEPAPLLQILGSALILAGAYVVSKIRSEFVQAI